MTRLLKLHDVVYLTGLRRTTIYKKLKLEEFPRPVSLGGRSVAWVSDEVDAWIQARIAARDECSQR